MAELLGIDTATSVGTVAVGDGQRVLAEVTLGVGMRHSEVLLPAIRFVLEHARLGPRQLDGVVVGAGPGSFTGVRIAAATAKALAHAAEVPLYAYSTLLALAASVAPASSLPPPVGEGRDGGGGEGDSASGTGAAAGDRGERPVCAVLDARRDDVYAACYRFTAIGPPETLMSPTVLEIVDLTRQMAGLAPVFVGDGALRHRAKLAGSDIAPPYLTVPRASALLWLATVQPDEGRVAVPARWEPAYVRASGAERGVRG